MTKKHFIQFAKLVKAKVEQGKTGEAIAIAEAVVLVNDNKVFDKARFIEACGLKGIY